MTDLGLRCQNCRCPLELDMSLVDLSLAQRDLVINSAHDHVEMGATSHPIPRDRQNLIRQIKHPSQLNLSDSNSRYAESYVFLPLTGNETGGSLSRGKTGEGDLIEEDEDEEEEGMKTLSSRISTLNNVFSIISSKNNIDYPVCRGCYDTILEKMKEEYNEVLKERDTYYEFIQKLEEQNKATNGESYDTKDYYRETNQLKKEKDVLLENLISLEDEEKQLNEELNKMHRHLKEKRAKDSKKLLDMNLRELEKLSFMNDVQSLKNQHVVTLNHIDDLRRLNIYNETFRISHKGPFGTINNLRLGSFPEIKVPWAEINAALGQVILLLSLIMDKMSLALDGYKLFPQGSHSKIGRLDDQTSKWVILHAFNEKDFSIGSLFLKETDLDKALVSILDIVSLLTEQISSKSQDSDSIQLPYEITGDRINRLPITLNGSWGSLEWTTACKFLLTNVKWLLAFSTTNQSKGLNTT